jgi:hypothetical protein
VRCRPLPSPAKYNPLKKWIKKRLKAVGHDSDVELNFLKLHSLTVFFAHGIGNFIRNARGGKFERIISQVRISCRSLSKCKAMIVIPIKQQPSSSGSNQRDMRLGLGEKRSP